MVLSMTFNVNIRNIKLLERDLSKERHELLKDQRLFRDRARKHFVETNKRRRYVHLRKVLFILQVFVQFFNDFFSA